MNYREMKDREYRRMWDERKRLRIECDTWEKLYADLANRYYALANECETLKEYKKLLEEHKKISHGRKEIIEGYQEITSGYEKIISSQKHKIEQLSEIIKSSELSSDEDDKLPNNDTK